MTRDEQLEIKECDEAYRRRDEALKVRDFKGASVAHFDFHQRVYAAWPTIIRLREIGFTEAIKAAEAAVLESAVFPKGGDDAVLTGRRIGVLEIIRKKVAAISLPSEKPKAAS